MYDIFCWIYTVNISICDVSRLIVENIFARKCRGIFLHIVIHEGDNTHSGNRED